MNKSRHTYAVLKENHQIDMSKNPTVKKSRRNNWYVLMEEEDENELHPSDRLYDGKTCVALISIGTVGDIRWKVNAYDVFGRAITSVNPENLEAVQLFNLSDKPTNK